jgi:hypothetical protein
MKRKNIKQIKKKKLRYINSKIFYILPFLWGIKEYHCLKLYRLN